MPVQGSVLKEKLLKILRFFGFDRAVSYAMVEPIWRVISRPITLIILTATFTQEQQGYYYTFASLLALQVFYELGLTQIIVTFVSHEFGKLQWGESGKISGDRIASERFRSLLRLITKWYALVAFLLTITLIPVGLIFFQQDPDNAAAFAWKTPWILAVIVMSVNLFISPYWAVIMGSDDVVTVKRWAGISGILGTCGAWLVMLFHGGLYAIFTVAAANIVVSLMYFIKRKPALITDIWKEARRHRINKEEASISWYREMWPLQWRTALTYFAGFFISQFFTPILFYYHGAVIAGKMGITLSLSNSLLVACCCLVTTKSPRFGQLIALSDWKELDALFFRIMRQSVFLGVMGAVIAGAALWFLQQHYAIGQRFISSRFAMLFLVSACAQIVITVFAVYLRAHKREPFLALTIIVGLLNGIGGWYLGKEYGVMGISLSYFIVNVFLALPAAYIIWVRCRKAWHIRPKAMQNA